MTDDAGVRSDEKAPDYYGRVIIEWPAPREGRALPGWGCAVYDADTGKMITTVSRITVPGVSVTADAQNVIAADLTTFAGDDGMPLLFPERIPDPQGRPGHIGSEVICTDDDGNIRTGTFPFLVAAMRVQT